MKISIVTPVFNDVRVARALDSILSQQCDHDLELIVVDAGSTDGTLAILERYRDKISVLISEPDQGIYDGMNKGIRRATGEIIAILNADDQYSDAFVVRDVASIFHQENVDACYGDLVFINKAGKTVRYWKSSNYRRIKWYLGWMPPHPTFFVRRHVYERHGLFDLRYSIAADFELMLRFLFKCHINVQYLPRTLVKMAVGGTSNESIAAIIRGNVEVMRACWQNGVRLTGLLVPFMKPARKVFQFIGCPR